MLPIRSFNDVFDLDFTEKGNCDIYLEDDKYHLEMDLPGYNKEDIHLEAHKGSIIVTAKKETKEEEKEGKKYVRRERTFGRIERSFYLGDIDEEGKKILQEGSLEYMDGIDSKTKRRVA